MKWITREHPRVDRVACPWLIERFVDKQAEFIYVASDQVMSEAQGPSRRLRSNAPGRRRGNEEGHPFGCPFRPRAWMNYGFGCVTPSCFIRSD